MLDEADQLLAPQFAADVSRLAMHCGKRAPHGLQTVVVSATLSSQVRPIRDHCGASCWLQEMLLHPALQCF